MQVIINLFSSWWVTRMKQGSKLLLVVLLGCFCCTMNALQLKKNYPQNYTIKKNDTLWGIANRYLKNPWQWQQLWQCNPQIHNPHLIYPGDKLHIKIVNGKPCLSTEPQVVKLSPGMKIEKGKSPIPPIPLALIKPFLTKSRVMTKTQFLKAPYVIAHQGEHLISTRGSQIYVRGLNNRHRTRFVVLHREEDYIDPLTKDYLGTEARYVATVELESYADPATFKVLAARGVINDGDRLFPLENTASLTQFIPQVPKRKVDAQIIAILRSISQVGRFNIVALNYGTSIGARSGQVLTIWKTGGVIHDKYTQGDDDKVRLPNKKIGKLMIFKTFSNVSYALVMEASQAVRLLDRVTSQ